MLNENTLQTVAALLRQLADDAITENRQRATGRTQAALRTETTPTSVELFGPRHFGALEYGRKPTENAGNGELYPRILEWVRVKGISKDDGIKKSKYTLEERTAKAITYFIHKQGTYLYRKGETFHGQKDPITRKFTPEVMDEIRRLIIGDVRLKVTSEVFSMLKSLSI